MLMWTILWWSDIFMFLWVATSPMLHQHQMGDCHMVGRKNKTKNNHMDQEQKMKKLQWPKDINFSFQLQPLDYLKINK